MCLSKTYYAIYSKSTAWILCGTNILIRASRTANDYHVETVDVVKSDRRQECQLRKRIAANNIPGDKWVNLKDGESMVPLGNTQQMPVCPLEEADARIIGHFRDAVNHGFSNIVFRTVDPDVIAIIIGHVDSLIAMNPNVNVAVAFNVGSNYKVLNVTSMALALPEKVQISFPVILAQISRFMPTTKLRIPMKVLFYPNLTIVHWFGCSTV